MSNFSIPKLRDYQLQAIDELRSTLAEHKRVILTVATGGGKTTIAAQMIASAAEKGLQILFLAHRKELVEQAKNRLHQFGIRPGIIMAGTRQVSRQVMVASQQTLIKRTLPQARLVIVDECHHSVSAGFRKILDQYTEQGAFIVGLTATPYRMDGKGLGDLYADIVAPITVADLIARGYLVPPRTFAPKKDFSDVKVTAGEYNAHDLYESKFNKRELYAQAVENYLKFAGGTKAICFCVNVEHSQNTVAAFQQAGISAEHVDGETPAIVRAKVLADFAAGKFKVLCNVNILTEGFDLPAIETVILNRATKSKSLYLQMVGRGLRPVLGKSYCTVIDQGANIWEHGPVDAVEKHTLEPAAKKKRGAVGVSPVKDCPNCQLMVYASARQCTECGYLWPASTAELKVTEFEEVRVAGLVVAGKKAKKPQPMPPHLEGKHLWQLSENELKEVAVFRGYKHGWVKHQVELRGGRRVAV